MFFSKLSQDSGNKDDEAYAQLLLSHAHQLYNASTHILPYRKYQESVHLGGDFYSSSDYRDELTLAALWMYYATKDQAFLNDASKFYQELGIANHRVPINWDDKYGAVYVLFARVTKPNDPNFHLRRQEAESYLDWLVTGERTMGGLMWWNDASPDASISCAMGASDLLLLYASTILMPLSQDPANQDNSLQTKANSYKEAAESQLRYIFGENPIHQNYVVGESPNSPKYPHHAGASGVTGLQEMRQSALPAHVLYGAVVGGPNKNDSFSDRMDNWKENEVALDYNGPYQNVIAHQIMYTTPDTVNVPSRTEIPDRKQFPKWGIALSVVLPLLAIAVTLGALWLHRKRLVSSKVHRHSPAESTMSAEDAQIVPSGQVDVKEAIIV
ncbi:hypothetical protein EC973_002475 [Apophysomyces ossiformis]|uniref:cellulase n=1 Tax=Apophysomyces ossiformis TaxID=679940 RepID=A0A8H7BIZ6_9FUNG|nr:hypothetical protein EC973_002475 [Apophysomyces ossiformis]